MLRQQRRNRSLLAGAILLCLLIGLYLAASKHASKSDASGKVVKHTVETPADVLKYWTADNMRKAKPAPMPHISAHDAGKRAPRRPRSKKARGKREE